MAIRKRKRIKRIPGDIVQVDLGNGESGYGHILENTIAFYDVKIPPDRPVAEIVAHPILFNVWVMDYAVTRGVWPVIGHAALDAKLLEEPLFYKKDIISKQLTIYRDSTGEETPATISACENLECAAVWDPEHIVDRLVDHFAGRPNQWVESLRP